MIQLMEILLIYLEEQTLIKYYIGAIENGNMSDQQLYEELHKPIIKFFKNVKYIHLSKTIFGVLVLPIFN